MMEKNPAPLDTCNLTLILYHLSGADFFPSTVGYTLLVLRHAHYSVAPKTYRQASF